MKMNQQLIETAKYVTIAAEAIVAYFLGLPVRPTCIVLLGRDCWPLFPLIKKAGLPVQYFLYSRLQVGELSTAQQWWTEVPRGALVVDTGYMGSILCDIQRFDRSIQGVLLCSHGNWPQVSLHGVTPQEVAAAIEEIPKLTTRTAAYLRGGLAHFASGGKGRDKDEQSLSRQENLHYNMLLCILLGVNMKWAWFTGATPQERLHGVDKTPPLRYKHRPKWGGVYVCDCQGNLAIAYQVTRPAWKNKIQGYLNALAAGGMDVSLRYFSIHPAGYAHYAWGGNKVYLDFVEGYMEIEDTHVFNDFYAPWLLSDKPK